MRDRPSSPVTRRHAVSAYALGCGLATGCAEPLPQSPAVDVLTYIGVEAEVTAARLPAPLVVDGRRRSEVAPGDTVRLRATFADVGRLYPPQASASGLEVEWYLCSESSCGGAGDDPPPCPAPLRLEPPDGELCLLGQTSEIEFTLDDPLAPLLQRSAQLQLLVLARDPSTSAARRRCYERLVDPQPGEDLFDCAVGGRLLPFGPIGALLTAAEDEGVDLELALGDLEVPDELWTQAPNTTPGPPLVTLVEERPGGDARTLELAPGDQLEVAPGSRVEVSASFDPERDLQEYWLLGQEYGLLEDLSATWYLVSEDPPEVELSYEPLLYSARWTAPAAGAPPLVLVLHALDTRFSEAVTWIRVGVADG